MNRSELLKSECCGCRGCEKATVLDAGLNRWFITMGHVGFNLRANNGAGYATKQDAERAIAKIAKR